MSAIGNIVSGPLTWVIGMFIIGFVVMEFYRAFKEQIRKPPKKSRSKTEKVIDIASVGEEIFK